MKYSAKGSKNYKKLLIPGAIVAVILLVGILEATNAINLFGGRNGNSTISTEEEQNTDSPDIYSPPTEQEQQEVDQNKEDPDSTRPTNPLPDKRVVISSIEQTGGKVVVQTQLYGVGWEKCDLTFSRNSTTVSKTADVLYQSQFSTCTGFSVNVSEFDTSGAWDVSLKATKNDGSTTTSDMATLNIVKVP